MKHVKIGGVVYPFFIIQEVLLSPIKYGISNN